MSQEKFDVLIVDDSFLMRAAVKRIIESETMITSIDEAADGAIALEMVQDKDYDVIMLDIEMPNMDGIEFMKRCKLYTDAMIVIISSLARVDSIQVEKAVCFGAYDVVAKPTGVLSTNIEAEKKHEILDILHRMSDSKA